MLHACDLYFNYIWMINQSLNRHLVTKSSITKDKIMEEFGPGKAPLTTLNFVYIHSHELNKYGFLQSSQSYRKKKSTELQYFIQKDILHLKTGYKFLWNNYNLTVVIYKKKMR